MRLVWLGYLWSRNSVMDTHCHPMMDQLQRSRSDGEEDRASCCNAEVLEKTNLSRCAVLYNDRLLNRRWKAYFVVFGSTRTHKQLVDLSEL